MSFPCFHDSYLRQTMFARVSVTPVVNFKLTTFFVYCVSLKGNSSKNAEGFDTTEVSQVLTSDM